MTVSVTIATFNRAGMVRQAVEAALAQTRVPDEIIVTDDASSDDTWPVLQEIAGKEARVRVFRREKNSGGVENWNYAIQQSRCDFIAWCSDDDRFLADHLEASLDYLVRHPEIGLVHSGFVDAVETVEGSEVYPRPLRFRDVEVLDRGGLLRYMTRYYDWPFHPSTIVMRRQVWETAGAFDRRWALADTDWFVRVVERFSVALLPRYGVMNRRHPGNWSNRVGSAKMQGEIFEIVEGAIERITNHFIERAFWRAIWRANVRLRLLLTLRQRIQSAHLEAAYSAWEALLRQTGRRGPACVERWGKTMLRLWCGRRQARFEDSRQSVSPL